MSTQNSWNSQDPVQVALGGTGFATAASNGVVYGAGTSPLGVTAAGTTGQVLIATTSNPPSWGTAPYTAPTWNDTTSGSATLAVNQNYVADKSTLTTFTLPSTAAFGSMFTIVGKGSGGWTVVYGSGQSIVFGSITTTTTTGSLSSSNAADCITFVCTTANTTFTVYSAQGNITYV